MGPGVYSQMPLAGEAVRADVTFVPLLAVVGHVVVLEGCDFVEVFSAFPALVQLVDVVGQVVAELGRVRVRLLVRPVEFTVVGCLGYRGDSFGNIFWNI